MNSDFSQGTRAEVVTKVPLRIVSVRGEGLWGALRPRVVVEFPDGKRETLKPGDMLTVVSHAEMTATT